MMVTEKTLNLVEQENLKKSLEEQSEYKEISGEIMDSEIKKIINVFSIKKSRINNNLGPSTK